MPSLLGIEMTEHPLWLVVVLVTLVVVSAIGLVLDHRDDKRRKRGR